MGDVAFVLAQTGERVTAVFSLAFLVMIGVLVIVWLLVRRIARWFHRSLKARQDLARSVADVSDRLEKLESKLEALGQDRS